MKKLRDDWEVFDKECNVNKEIVKVPPESDPNIKPS